MSKRLVVNLVFLLILFVEAIILLRSDEYFPNQQLAFI